MTWNDGIDKIHCYSLTDLHDFAECSFRFYVRHHLGKKYELDEGNTAIALGNLLDQSIKLFHESKAYGCEIGYLPNIVKRAEIKIKEYESSRYRPNFYTATAPFLTEDVYNQAVEIFQSYYRVIDSQVKPSLGAVGFLEKVIKIGNQACKLWGGPDTLELGDDGVPEVVDYKSREALAFNLTGDDRLDSKSRERAKRAKQQMDMDLMPKVYTLLAAKPLLKQGYSKARFIVRFWQDPLEDSLKQEFELGAMMGEEFLLMQKIEQILKNRQVSFCQGRFCSACNFDKKEVFIKQLEALGLITD